MPKRLDWIEAKCIIGSPFRYYYLNILEVEKELQKYLFAIILMDIFMWILLSSTFFECVKEGMKRKATIC